MDEDYAKLKILRQHEISSNGVQTFPLFPCIINRELSIRELLSITRIIDIKKEENLQFDYFALNEKESNENFNFHNTKLDRKPYTFSLLVQIDPSLFESDRTNAMIEIIQKRMITWFSCHPNNSK